MAEPRLTHCAASLLGPNLTLLSPNSMSLTSVGLHLLRTGLELGSVSPLSIGPHVMVSSGLSSGGQRSHFKAVVNKAEHDGEEEGAEIVLSRQRML